jgi:hypothetical protein
VSRNEKRAGGRVFYGVTCGALVIE